MINVYTKKHQNKKNGTVGKLGDRVLVAVLGQKKKGIIVGMKQKQRHAIPRYCTVLYCNVLHCTVMYYTVLYCTVLYCTIRHPQVRQQQHRPHRGQRQPHRQQVRQRLGVPV